MSETNEDQELSAIQQVIAALSDLDSEARARVISYVSHRLGITSPGGLADATAAAVTGVHPVEASVSPPEPGRRQIDIRTFGEEKSPRSTNERVAVVAYYLSELAPAAERKTEIAAADITRYFKQARFPLPRVARMALVNAKNAGYLDAGSERGTYKLNAVGHNLVAHALPAASTTSRRNARHGKRKGAAKSKKPAARR